VKIRVNISDHDSIYPSIDCPLRNTEYGTCQAWDFLNPEDSVGLKCLKSVEIVEGEDAGFYVYVVPDECPLRSGKLELQGI